MVILISNKVDFGGRTVTRDKYTTYQLKIYRQQKPRASEYMKQKQLKGVIDKRAVIVRTSAALGSWQKCLTENQQGYRKGKKEGSQPASRRCLQNT